MKTLALTCALMISALDAQNLAGTVNAADTGAPIAGATVVAIQKTSPGEKPVISFALSDSTGQYKISAAPGQYALCVHTMSHSLYLDPCQWGGPIAATIGASAASTVPISLQKGARFIVRVHDKQQVLSQAETVKGAAVSASVTSPSVKLFPLPLIYSDGIIRDYGTVVPISVPMSVTISSSSVTLNNNTGTSLSASPIAFEVLPTDIEVMGAPPSPVTRMFPTPNAKVVHVYATGLK